METGNKSGKQTKEQKDSIIGRALSRAMKPSPPAESCPPLEHIAAFTDGNLGEHERDSLMGHLAYCNRCYEIFSLAQEMTEEEEEVIGKAVAMQGAVSNSRASINLLRRKCPPSMKCGIVPWWIYVLIAVALIYAVKFCSSLF